MSDDSPAAEAARNGRIRKSHSPLSVVALFFGLVELGLAYCSGISSGYVQIAVLGFMGTFAIGIAVTFFVFLWYRNWVFYPPSEFSAPSVQAFVNAMRGPPGVSISQVATDEISRAFADEVLSRRLQAKDVPEEQRELIGLVVGEIRREAVKNVAASVLHIDARPLKGPEAPVWEEPYIEELTVRQLLDRVWLNVQPLPPYGYGTMWLLKDAASGEFFSSIGPAHGAAGSIADTDMRTVRQVGIMGGMRLEVVPGS